MIRDFRDLKVWQEAMNLAEIVYELTACFPKEERYGLTAQARSSAVSVPSNIAEGHSRSSTGDYLRFLSIAPGSLAELETQILLAVRFKYLSGTQARGHMVKAALVGKMLWRLKSSLKT